MSTPHEKLRVIFSAPGWTRFIDVLAGYRERGSPLPGSVTLREPTDEERRHHARLLRLPTPSAAAGLRYDLAQLAAALQTADLPTEWTEILAAVRGPLAAEKLAAHAARQDWEVFWPLVVAQLDQSPFPANREWLDALKRDGTLKRLSKGDVALAMRLVELSTRVLQALPLPDDQLLARVAARYGNGSHSLDPASVLSTLVLRGLALRLGRAMPSRSDGRRELWSAFRVVCDELSAPVLTFNLAIGGPTLLPQLVQSASAEKQPIHLTSRLLWSAEWPLITCPPAVFVCENPTIVSLAANALGQRCPPLVCVDGEPKPAARVLLRRLRAGESALYYHGDFDWPGVAIAERVFREFGALPWCFDSAAYAAAASCEGRPLEGKPSPTPWSPALAEAMERTGFAYDEELLADTLLHTLEQRAAGV